MFELWASVLQALDAKSVFIELQFDGRCNIEPVLCNQLSNFSKKIEECRAAKQNFAIFTG